MEIRSARFEDLSQLIQGQWPGANIRELETYRSRIDPAGKPDGAPFDTVLVAEKDGRLVGYLHYWCNSTEPDEYELAALAIDPSLPVVEAALVKMCLDREFREAGY